MISVGIILAPVGACHARSLYVDDDAPPGSGDGSWEFPFTLIAEGMDEASFGDTVAVMPGVYTDLIGVDMHDDTGMNRAAVVMKDGVVLQSTSGPDSTTIEGLGVEAAVYFDDCGSESALRGFTIFTDWLGWGLRTSVLCHSSSPIIESNVLRECYSGIYCRESSHPTIRYNALVAGGSIILVGGSGGFIEENTVEGHVGVACLGPASRPVTIASNTIGGAASTDHRGTIGIHVSTSDGGADVAILDNTIQGKDIAVRSCLGTLHGNRFLDNVVNIKIGDAGQCSPWEDIDAEYNWWGTPNLEEISAKIIDCQDDPDLESCVDFIPWCLDESCSQTAVAPTSWSSIKTRYRQ